MKYIPVICGSSYKNKGVQKLLDAVVDYMPSPLDVPHIKGLTLDGKEEERETSDEAPFSGLSEGGAEGFSITPVLISTSG